MALRQSPEYERIEWSAIGVPLKLEMAFTGQSGIGLGIEGLVNVNGHRTFAIAVLEVTLGRFRP